MFWAALDLDFWNYLNPSLRGIFEKVIFAFEKDESEIKPAKIETDILSPPKCLESFTVAINI